MYCDIGFIFLTYKKTPIMHAADCHLHRSEDALITTHMILLHLT